MVVFYWEGLCGMGGCNVGVFWGGLPFFKEFDFTIEGVGLTRMSYRLSMFGMEYLMIFWWRFVIMDAYDGGVFFSPDYVCILAI